MKYIYVALLLFCSMLQAQVGIGTVDIPESAQLILNSKTQSFVPPRMQDAEMRAIANPVIGSIVFNTTLDAMYLYSNGGWQSMSFKTLPTMIWSKNFVKNSHLLPKTTNVHTLANLGNADVISNSTDVFEVLSEGTVRIKKSGNYLFNGAFSVHNLQPGNRKFVLLLKKSGTEFGYLSRGMVDAPIRDEWTTTGSIVLNITAGDIISYYYVLNINTDVHMQNLNLSIIKLE